MKPKIGKPKLTDAERHKRFVAMAKQVEASNESKDFDAAFAKIAQPKSGIKKGASS